MLMRHGEIYQCMQCLLQIQVIQESKVNPLHAMAPRCCCGEMLTLVQSGSESVRDSVTGTNKITAEQR